MLASGTEQLSAYRWMAKLSLSQKTLICGRTRIKWCWILHVSANPQTMHLSKHLTNDFATNALTHNGFLNLMDVLAKYEAWRLDYYTLRPHDVLCGMSTEHVLRKFFKESKLPRADIRSGSATDGNCKAILGTTRPLQLDN